MKTLRIHNLSILRSILAVAAIAPGWAAEPTSVDQREIPAIVRPFAFNQESPETRYLGYDGGPGANAEGRIYNSRKIEHHTLGIRYDNRRVALYFQRDDGEELRCEVGTYLWPQFEGKVYTSVFATEGAKKILVCVGGVPAAVIFPDSLEAVSISETSPDEALRWDSAVLSSFERTSNSKE